MTEPIITEEQGQRLVAALETWTRIHIKEHGKPPEWNRANITKSCLLGRLIYEGKEPLEFPPPTFMSAPWYSLIEDGRSYMWRHFGVFRVGDRIIIGQDPDWVLEEEHDDVLIVSYPNWGRWVLRPTRDDERIEGGRTCLDDDGRPSEIWRPSYFDTVLELDRRPHVG